MRSRKLRTPSSSNTLPKESMGTRWTTLPKASTGGAPMRKDGLSGANEMGEARLDCGVALAQSIILCVADLRSVETVVELVVIGDDLGKSLQLGSSLALVERGYGLRFRALLASPLALGLAFAHGWLVFNGRSAGLGYAGDRVASGQGSGSMHHQHRRGRLPEHVIRNTS